MSIQFNDTSTYKGLVQLYEQEIGVSLGDVSGSTTKLKQFAADVNIAWDDYLNFVFKYDGGWQFDDSNHTDFPQRTMTLTSGTRQYALASFTADAGANLMLDIHKVFVKNQSGIYEEIYRVDKMKDDDVENFDDGNNVQGTPTRYDVTGGYLTLDPVPNYTQSTGIKVLVRREPAYFASTDTTKKPGCIGTHHKYFYLKPALEYAGRHSLANYEDIFRKVKELENDIKETYTRRDQEQKKIMTPCKIQYL